MVAKCGDDLVQLPTGHPKLGGENFQVTFIKMNNLVRLRSGSPRQSSLAGQTSGD